MYPISGDHWTFTSVSTWTGRAQPGSAGPEAHTRTDMQREIDELMAAGWRSVYSSRDKMIMRAPGSNEKRTVSIRKCPGHGYCVGCATADAQREA